YSSIAYGAAGEIPPTPPLKRGEQKSSPLSQRGVGGDFHTLESLYSNFLKPDIVFLLKVPPKECIKRIESRGNEKELFEKEEYLEKVWKNYEILASKHEFIKIIDGTLGVEEVSTTIKNQLQST
ncbi:deoxynucleoside kinase, partial [Candidatus Peregrinibacteria bacterium]|nr:deoxynucleoside kinase [Candidatus Peregrinibacteria bacterium]